MNCEKAFNRYLELDKFESVPLGVTLHLLLCPSCRTAVRRLSRAERALAAPLAVSHTEYACGSGVPAIDPAVREAIERINAAGLSYPDLFSDRGRVSLTRWLVSGAALAAGFAILPFSDMGAWSRLAFGTGYLVSYFSVCGLAVTVWCGLFVGTNIDFFVKKFGIVRPA